MGPESELTGRTAIVTGSTSGIGRAIAEALAGAGAAVMINGFGDSGQIQLLRQSLENRGGRPCAYHAADVRNPQEVAALFEATVEALGPPQILVNNAGIQHVAPLEAFPEERWSAVMDTNLTACFHTIKRAIPLMRDQGFGRIINIASAHGLVASPQKSAYVAAKHGLVGLTKVAALETANSGITVNAICPGWVLTPLVQQQIEARVRERGSTFEEEATAMLEETQPLHAFTPPQAIAKLCLFLCSEAAATLTGSTLSMDGGWVAH